MQLPLGQREDARPHSREPADLAVAPGSWVNPHWELGNLEEDLFLPPPGHWLVTPPPSVLEAERLCGGYWRRISRRHGGTARPCWVPHKEAGPSQGGGSLTMPACPLPAARECPPGCTQIPDRHVSITVLGPWRTVECSLEDHRGLPRCSLSYSTS